MRLRPHLGTLIFPPLALLAQMLSQGSQYGSEVPLRVGVILVAFAFLAITSWHFLRRYPSVGVLFSACLVLSFPVTRNYGSGADEFFAHGVFLLNTLAGVAGTIYFGVLGARRTMARRRRQPRGFPVLPASALPPEGRAG